MSEWQGEPGGKPMGLGRARLGLGSFGGAAAKPGGATGAARTRFAKDGDVPVVIKPRKPILAMPADEDRAIRAEQALAAEREARLKAEDVLAAVQRRVQSLQTQIAHLQIAHTEALRVERDARLAAEAALSFQTVQSPARVKAAATPQARGLGKDKPKAGKPAMAPRAAAPKPARVAPPKPAAAQPDTDKAVQDRAAVLRLLLHGALDRDAACARLNLKPRSLRDLLAQARLHGAEAAARGGRAPTRSRRPVTRAELQAKRDAVLPLLRAGKITRQEACARLNLKPRGLRKILLQSETGGVQAG